MQKLETCDPHRSMLVITSCQSVRITPARKIAAWRGVYILQFSKGLTVCTLLGPQKQERRLASGRVVPYAIGSKIATAQKEVLCGI